ncbi:T9SS type A sorting domain-containing protein [uncultured Kordia sp.]|uniref:T9SS type A sorting domain-containing protein n=1 Tax=uncultured Kordia sp. TaxID=507699 RepID=UPI00263987EF|nr:T9SS type A sorting domain-containing protein [uncultured Kordia sp.]
MKTKLLLVALLFSFVTYSQTISSFNSDPNTDFTIVTPAAALDQSPTGMNAIWTFNNLTAGGTNIDTYAPPTAAELTTYPGTTEVLSITTQGGTPTVSEFFQRTDGSGTYITGASQGDIVLNYSSTNAFVGLFPLNFGANNSGTAAGTFTFMGTSGTFTGTFTATVEAYGTLNIPDPTFPDYSSPVTRLRIDQTLSFSIPPIFNNIGTLTQTTYYYYDNTADNIAFRYTNATLVSAFLGINQTTETYERNTAVTLSRNTVDASNFQLYPNPAKDFITIDSKDNQVIKSVSIVDMQGRNVFSSTVETERISVSNLQQGMYFVTLETETGATTTKKFMKQ